jgi:hypothetical protein
MYPDPDPTIFVLDLQEADKKLIFNQNFSAFSFLKVHLHHFFEIKSKRSHKTVGIQGFLFDYITFFA